MSTTLMVVLGAILLFIGYVFYGKYLAEKVLVIDPEAKTPAETMYDGVDYVPTQAPVLLGHHFASIAGAGPITGPIAAAVFGWVPVFLWVVLGSIFFGGVHDYSALVASARHEGKSIGEVVRVHIGERGQFFFLCFWRSLPSWWSVPLSLSRRWPPHPFCLWFWQPGSAWPSTATRSP